MAGIAGLITIVFQLSIIVSGNLSWLNWLTLVLAFSTLDAKFFSGLAAWAPALHPVSPAVQVVNYVLLAGVFVMSIPVVTNMLSARQIMNTNFNSLHLVGTYGAFGSITRTRYEIIVEGTDDAVITSGTRWREYEFKGKPGDRGIPAASDCAVSSAARLADVVRSHVQLPGLPVVCQSRCEAARRRQRRAELAALKSFFRQAAPLRARAALRVPLYCAGRAQRKRVLVEADFGGSLFPGHFIGQSRFPAGAEDPGLARAVGAEQRQLRQGGN